jgi:hypothetical protein
MTRMRPLPRGELLMDVPPVSSVVVPREVHVANVEPEESEPQPDGHPIVAEMVLIHVCSRLTTVSVLPASPNPIYLHTAMISDIVAGA